MGRIYVTDIQPRLKFLGESEAEEKHSKKAVDEVHLRKDGQLNEGSLMEMDVSK